jgi:hypothetical protein
VEQSFDADQHVTWYIRSAVVFKRILWLGTHIHKTTTGSVAVEPPFVIQHGIVENSHGHSWCNKDIVVYYPDEPLQFISIQTNKERIKITLSIYKVMTRKNVLQIHTNLCRRCTIAICNTSLILWTNIYNPILRQ